ncbi:MAG: nuclease-related domain-containing protein [Acidobacteriota bacterium]
MVLFKKTEIRQALAKRDAKRVGKLLDGVDLDEEAARELLRLVRHTGCLIDIYNGYRGGDWLKALIEVLTDSLSGNPLKVLFSLVAEATIITLVFRLIKDAVKKLDISALPPEHQAWAVIKWAGSHLAILHEKALTPPKEGPFLGRAGAHVSDGGEEGRTFDVDEQLGGTEQFVRMTLSMLAYEHGWWNQEGKLIVPPFDLPVDVDVHIAGAHFYLASIWDLVLGASETLRFWGDSVDMTSAAIEGAPEELDTIINFDLRLGNHLYFAISRLRVMQTEIDTHMYAIGLPEPDYGDVATEAIPLPPNGFVSFEEVATHVTLDMLYHFDLGSGTSVNNLNPAVMTRGYAVLKHCYDQEFGKADLSMIEIDRNMLMQALRNGSLSEQEADAFLATITFGRDSKDLFDCPVITSGDGKLYLLRGMSQFSSLPRVVVSRLTSLRSKFENKGPRFELEVIDEFVENGIAAKGFTFVVDSNEYQFDCVVLWGKYVFVLECKNYLLPSESAAQEFYFMESMNDAVEQVKRLTAALQERRAWLVEQFGDVPEGLIFVPVVLNAMPFSTDQQLDGVYLYDYSALNRFFEGKISVNQPIKTNEGWVRVEHVVKKLWEDSSPTPLDFINQMTTPIQLAAEFPRWHQEDMRIGLTEKIGLVVPVLRKDAASSKDLLKAIGVNDETAEQMLQFGDELHRRLKEDDESTDCRA